ncbi:hypothetical protein ACFLXN_02320 [Chloroflexota bacterium]
MKRLLGYLNKKDGQVLPMVLIVLALTGLIIGPFLSYSSTSLIGSRVQNDAIDAQYAADAGVEDAIWNLIYGDFTTTVLVDENDTHSYTMNNIVDGQAADPVNDILPDIIITKVSPYLARDNFESNTLSGGTGWLSDWQVTGDAEITTSYLPYEGSRHLQLKSVNESAKRSIDLSGKSSIHLQFWAKANSFEPGDETVCQVSADGIVWDTVQKWTDGDDDNIYRFYDIDLSSYAPYSSSFWIMFDANMDQVNDWIFFDNVVIKFVAQAAIIMPEDDFETGTFTGGIGWLAPWMRESNAVVTPQQSPYQGLYHVYMKNLNSDVSRAANLAGQSGLRLQFWAKMRRFEASDTVSCQVSANGVDWTTLKTWVNGDDDNIYRFYDLSLAAFAPYSAAFWVRFDSGMNQNNDDFYFDALQIVGGGAGIGPDSEYYDITSVAGSVTVTSVVTIDVGVLGIVSWHIQ